MLTDLQKKKLGRLFAVLDADHNNQLERSDYINVVSNVAAMHDWKQDSPQYATAERLYLAIWDQLKMLADQNGDGKVTLEEFLDFHSQMLSTPAMYRQITGGTVDLLFDAFDRDKDGTLSQQDYRDFLQGYGIRDTGAADEAFKKLDLGGKGRIAKADVTSRVQEFYFSDDAGAAGNWLFGRYH